MKRILIFNVNWLGDVLLSTPAIRAIRENFPQSYIACIISPRCREVLEGNPNLDELIFFDERGKDGGFWRKLKFIFDLKKKGFDLVYLFHRSFTRALIVYLAGIPERVGFYTRKRGLLLTKKIPMPPCDSLHRADYYLNLLTQAGLTGKDRALEFYFSDEDRKFASELLTKQGVGEKDLLIVLNPGGNWSLKRWPIENFTHLAKDLIREFKAKVAIVGSKEDLVLADAIAEPINSPSLIILAGKTSLKQLGAVLEKANLVISADTSPLHISVAVGTKVIGLFGPTLPSITGPYPKDKHIIIQKDVGCPIPCYNLKCSDNRCMKAITVEDILKCIESPFRF